METVLQDVTCDLSFPDIFSFIIVLIYKNFTNNVSNAPSLSVSIRDGNSYVAKKLPKPQKLKFHNLLNLVSCKLFQNIVLINSPYFCFLLSIAD